MKCLAIETTAVACSAAVAHGDCVLERSEPISRGHAERLMPLIGEVLTVAGVVYGELDLIAVATGPGSFTGLRVGLAAARGIALATAKPCLGVTSFEAALEDERAAAEAAWGRGESVIVVLDSRRSEVFAQAFLPPAGAPLPALVGAPAALASRLDRPFGLILAPSAPLAAAVLAGWGGAVPPRVKESRLGAAAVARIAGRCWRQGLNCGHAPEPVYLRAPEIGNTQRP